VAVVIPTILRPSLADALSSVFAQSFQGNIHVLVGIDSPQGDVGIIDQVCAKRPSHCTVQVLYPGYSTSVRHGGLHPARDGGVMRAVMTYLANARCVAYLDDDNWWATSHLHLLRMGLDTASWGFALRWFVHPVSGRPVCVDEWESVGPGRGVFCKGFGGFVDPNCLMLDKLACAAAVPLWNRPLAGDAKAMSADRNVFAALRAHSTPHAVEQATVFYRLDPADPEHSSRLQAMGRLYEQAGNGTREVDAVEHKPVRRVRDFLFDVSPYTGFDPTLWPEDTQGWNSDHPLLLRAIEQIRPVSILEIGSWKGRSAINMARKAQSLGLSCEIVCVDTWLGSAEHWRRTEPGWYKSLRIQHGYPQLYFTFLANVVRSGFQEMITPFPNTSNMATQLLLELGYRFGLCYLDAAHDFEAVKHDLAQCWQLLQEPGILIGDDFGVPGVRAAVNQFASEHKLDVTFSDEKYLLTKGTVKLGVPRSNPRNS